MRDQYQPVMSLDPPALHRLACLPLDAGLDDFDIRSELVDGFARHGRSTPNVPDWGSPV
jgi:hypothetical protein